jgi:hypothetical protein
VKTGRAKNLALKACANFLAATALVP